MKVKVFTGGIVNGRVTSPGKWMNGEVLGDSGYELICSLPGIPQCSVPKTNVFKPRKFTALKTFAEDNGYENCDDLMNDGGDITMLISAQPIQTGWTGDGNSCICFLTDNGFGVNYGYYSCG